MALLKDYTCIKFSTDGELSQLEEAFHAAGYRWFIPDAYRQSLAHKAIALHTGGSVCPGYGGDNPVSFSEGMALLGAPVEEKAKTFKVGDRVRIVRWAEAETLLWNSEMRAAISKCGIVTGVGWCGKNFIRVKTENCEYYYLPESLELVTEPEAEKPVAESPRPMPGRELEAKPIGEYLITPGQIDFIFEPFFNLFHSTENQMSETKTTPTTIERRIALAAGRILWRAAWPVRKLAGGVVKGAVNMFYTALFGGVVYGGYELIQFLQAAVTITWPE